MMKQRRWWTVITCVKCGQQEDVMTNSQCGQESLCINCAQAKNGYTEPRMTGDNGTQPASARPAAGE